MDQSTDMRAIDRERERIQVPGTRVLEVGVQHIVVRGLGSERCVSPRIRRNDQRDGFTMTRPMGELGLPLAPFEREYLRNAVRFSSLGELSELTTTHL